MHFKNDPISDMHAKNYLIIWGMKPLSGPSKFCHVFWCRLFQRGPVEYNYPYPAFTTTVKQTLVQSIDFREGGVMAYYRHKL